MKKGIQWLTAAIRRGLKFIHHELWEEELSVLPQPRRALIRLLRTGHLVIRGIKQDSLPQHASALTLGTLISIVPILAITFSMYKGLGAGEEEIRGMLLEWIEDMPLEFQDFILQMLEQYAAVNVAAMGGIFLVVVLYIVVKMLGGIEQAFNRVWYIEDSRNWLRKVSNYISILVIVPVLVVAASAASALIGAYLQEQMEAVAWIWRSLLKVGPLLAVWLAFSFLYIFVPNTQVKLGPGLISGLVGAVMWLAWQGVYINFQVGVSKYNAIYGTFASVPIFLGWLYISWVIVLLGAEVAYAVQNADTYKLERHGTNASVRARLMIALGIMQRAGSALNGQGRIFSATEYAREKQVSVRLVNEMVRLLQRVGLLGGLSEQPDHYTLLKSPETLTVKEVLDAILEDGTDPAGLGLDQLDACVQRTMSDLEAGWEQQLKGRTVKQMIEAGS